MRDWRVQMCALSIAACVPGGCGHQVPPHPGAVEPVVEVTAAAPAHGLEVPWWQQVDHAAAVPATPISLAGDVLFDPDSAALAVTADAQLRPVLAVLVNRPRSSAVVHGHTDAADGGPPETALALSRARAESVRTWLTERGVDAARITILGWGATKPLHPSDTEEHRAANPRCDIVIAGEID